MTTVDPLDWPDQHRTYWTALGQTVGASEQQTRMAYAISQGFSQAQAARFAKYEGVARTAGYAAARSRAVQTMLAMAEGDGWAAPAKVITEDDKDKLLNELMQSRDAATRLRAIEASDKRREREVQRRREEAETETHDPMRTLTEIGEHNPMLAIFLAQGCSMSFPDNCKHVTQASINVQLEKIKNWFEWHFAGRPTPYHGVRPSHGEVQPDGTYWHGVHNQFVHPKSTPADTPAKPTPEATAHGDQPADDQEPPD